jgi:hypothetical protein
MQTMERNMEGHWAELDDHLCPCKGGGWAEINSDIYKECPIHFIGQLHPQSRSLLLDDPNRLADEERRSQLRFRIQEAKDQIASHQKSIKEAQGQIVALELELINKTPTRKMEAVQVTEPQVEVLDEYEDFLLED